MDVFSSLVLIGLVLAILIAMDLAADRWGTDSRVSEGRDWP
jgi:hypothetical protein